MLTPKFEISQTETRLHITVHAPYTNISDTEVYVHGKEFGFFSHPYILRLKLPGEVMDVDASNGIYDADKGTFVLTLEKANKGEYFPDLDLVSRLIVKFKNFPSKPKIEVLDGQKGIEGSYAQRNMKNSSDTKSLTEQTVTKNECLFIKPKYGFANRFCNMFKNLTYEAKEIFDLPDPDVTPASSRTELRMKKENKDFSDDHYLADRAYRSQIDQMLLFRTVWDDHYLHEIPVKLSDGDVDRLKNISKCEYLLTLKENEVIYLAIVDVIAAYCYDIRTTESDPTSESAWTINKLSSTLSWFEEFDSVKDVLKAFMRRSLCYPLYRNWDLTVKVIEDVQNILYLGKRCVLKCLLNIHSLFSHSEPRFLLNRLYVEDYCIWIQTTDDGHLCLLAKEMETLPTKEELKLDLVELEFAAKLVEEEHKRQEKHDEMVMQLNAALEEMCISEISASSSSTSCTDEEESLDSDDVSS